MLTDDAVPGDVPVMLTALAPGMSAHVASDESAVMALILLAPVWSITVLRP
jgi:hypothetical protein